MSNSYTYFKAPGTHFIAQDSDMTAGYESVIFNSNFRIKQIDMFVITAFGGSTYTIERVRSGVSATIAILSSNAVGPATFTSNINQTNALIQSGDKIKVTASNATTVANIFIDFIQYVS